MEENQTEETFEPVEEVAQGESTLEASPAMLEALLLAHGEPVTKARLKETMRCEEEQFNAILQALQNALADSERGLEVVHVGGKLQLRTKVAFSAQVRELMAVKPRRLSQAALETLSVVAYQQPIVKSEIDKIRGVDVAPTLKTLIEKNLVAILGYQATVGQPAVYGTTEQFLQIFGLESLSELPALRDLKALAREPGEAQEEESATEQEREPELAAVGNE